MTAPDLPVPTRERLAEVGRADLVVGIPSYQNVGTIGQVVRAAQTGLAKYFPGERCLVLNCDGGSTDGTQATVAEAAAPEAELVMVAHPVHPVHRFSVPYHGLPGKGSAFRTIIAAADALGARACAVVDADLRSITPEWIQLLLGPVVQRGFDYVAPYYQRHKFDGTITNSVVYPLTRALYGPRIRQPIGGDFGLSRALCRHLLAQPVWDGDVARFGVDIWMTTTAICSDYAVCQTYLGAKLHDPKDPAADLSDMLVQVLGTVFRLMETHEDRWRAITTTTDVPLFGFRFDVGLDPVHVDVARMVDHFRRGAADLMFLWKAVLSPRDCARLAEAASHEHAPSSLDDALWVRIVYDLAVAFHRRAMDRDSLLRASLPLYLGRVASFVLEMADARAQEVEARLEQLCLAFEAGKDYLVSRWEMGRPDSAARAGGRRRPANGASS